MAPNTARRDFMAATGAVAIAAAAASHQGMLRAESVTDRTDRSAGLVKQLFESLTEAQCREVCFDWNHNTEKHGILRTHVSNNWQISPHRVTSEFYNNDQQGMIEAIFWSLYNPDWKDRIRKQLNDDAGGYGKGQSISLFGNPQQGPFEPEDSGRT